MSVSGYAEVTGNSYDGLHRLSPRVTTDGRGRHELRLPWVRTDLHDDTLVRVSVFARRLSGQHRVSLKMSSGRTPEWRPVPCGMRAQESAFTINSAEGQYDPVWHEKRRPRSLRASTTEKRGQRVRDSGVPQEETTSTVDRADGRNRGATWHLSEILARPHMVGSHRQLVRNDRAVQVAAGGHLTHVVRGAARRPSPARSSPRTRSWTHRLERLASSGRAAAPRPPWRLY